MKFKNDAERLAHPIASLIPKNLWSEMYEYRSYSIEQFTAESIDLLKNYSHVTHLDKKRIWLLALLLHQEKIELLIDFAQSRLQLNTLELLTIVASLGNLAIIMTFSQSEIKAHLNELFKVTAKNGHLAILRYVAEPNPEQIPAAISNMNFYAFWTAA